MDVMKKVPVREQAPDVRNKNFDEVCLGYNKEEAMEEATRCLNCKILPLCLGPCSQKLLEAGQICDNICSLKSIDISLEDYLKMEFEMRYVLQHCM